MKFMALIYGVEADWEHASEAEQASEMAAYYDYDEAASAAGVLVAGDALHPVATAKAIRVRDGERTVTDGPFAETKEQLGGYYVLECKDLDEAIEWAARIPGAKTGSVEVRPIMEFPSREEFEAQQGASAQS